MSPNDMKPINEDSLRRVPRNRRPPMPRCDSRNRAPSECEGTGTLTRAPLLDYGEKRPESAASDAFGGSDGGDNPPGTNSRHLSFSRMAYNLPQFKEQFVPTKGKKGRPGKAWEAAKSCCSWNSLGEKAKSLFPIIDWGWNYNFKRDIFSDLIAGLTIIVFHVPQAMGYSLIANVSPVYGLYSAFFCPLVYSLMGTSKQCAVGTFAVISLMTGSLVSQVAASKGMGPESNIQIAVTVSFLVGLYQLIFGILQLGFVSVYLSEQLVSGFTTSASLYVFTSQLPYLLGIHVPYQSGIMALINAYVDIFKHIGETNYATLTISVTCCAVLLLFKIYINPYIQKRTGVNIPFPIELLLVIIGTSLSYFLDLNRRWGVHIVGPIPKGLPMPSPPPWSLVLELATRAIPLAIVAYALTISVGKIFAHRHSYNIDSNQELLALGSTNIVGSFFSCLPSAASLSRSAVQESAGGKTQLVSLINCSGILLVLYLAGPVLETLPQCILASVIAVALKTLLSQIQDFIRYTKVSTLDGSIWAITFFAVIFLDVDLGLYVGLAYSLVTLIYKSQRPKIYLLGSINRSDVYVPVKKYASAEQFPDIRIYQFCGPLHFANIEYFKAGLIRKTGVSVNEVVARREKQRKKDERKSKRINRENLDIERNSRAAGSCYVRQQSVEEVEEVEETKNYRLELPSHIIIDCSMFSYIDTSGISQLKVTVQDYESIGIKTFLAGTATHVDKMLEKDNFYVEVPPQHVFISVHDAVHHALDDQMASAAAPRLDDMIEGEEGEEELETDDYSENQSMSDEESDVVSCSSPSDEPPILVHESIVGHIKVDQEDGSPKFEPTDSPEIGPTEK